MAMDVLELKRKAERYGQGHLFRFFDSLSPAGRENLLRQVVSLDFDMVGRLAGEFMRGANPAEPAEEIEEADIIRLPRTEEDMQRDRKARAVGEEALRAGRAAVFLVAGGQGTRLGFDGPKGEFEIGPVTKRSLFRIHAEKIAAIRRRYRCALPWGIMTSEANDARTRKYFENNGFFGLPADSVRFCVQESLPAVDFHGRIVLDAPDHIHMSPNGHGGSLKAMYASGILEWFASLGADTIYYFQVDNVLLRIADPTFIGHHILGGADMSLKVLAKKDPYEKVGVYALKGGKPAVIEYSDLPAKLAEARNPDGSLKYWAGSIAIHLLDASFVRRLNESGFALPYHKAEKAVPFVDDTGRTVKPREKNALKFETFVFDALPLARRVICVETRRWDDFSPVKNATGLDSVETARRDMIELYSRWLEAAGAKIPRDESGRAINPVEISPLISLEGENLEPWRGREIGPMTVI